MSLYEFESEEQRLEAARELLREREKRQQWMYGGLERTRLYQIGPVESGSWRKWFFVNLKVTALGSVYGLAGYLIGVLIAMALPVLDFLHIRVRARDKYRLIGAREHRPSP
jgi:hypothetical protein